MSKRFKVIDLFAGPGGLAEGFSSLKDSAGNRIFDIALSVEKESSAFATLRLRSFVRQFARIPDAYYDYLGQRLEFRELISCFPEEWAAATGETHQLELGTPAAAAVLNPILDSFRNSGGTETVLIGGPPCQAYSLVGRARNKGIKDYDAAQDHRHFLYKEYIRIIERLQPVAFVMENVKGILSSKVNGEGIFERVLSDLRSAGGSKGSYTLVPLVSGGKGVHGGHIIRSEDYGIPQRRHRVILLGVRSDVFRRINPEVLANSALSKKENTVSVKDAVGEMIPLRSGLSRGGDDDEKWGAELLRAFESAREACTPHAGELELVAAQLGKHLGAIRKRNSKLGRSSTAPAKVLDDQLSAWLVDENQWCIPNNETRGHMASDLARYAFAATFAEVHKRSPKAADYPRELWPAHGNWESGKFADRFRVQMWDGPSTTITSHISKDGHYFIHPDPLQCRSLTVREAARLQTFPDNYLFEGNRTEQYVQVGNAVPPLLARQIAEVLIRLLNN